MAVYMEDLCVFMNSSEQPRSVRGRELVELAEQQSCSVPSAHTRASSVDSRLYPNKHLRGAAVSWNTGRIPRPQVGSRSVFNVGSSSISASNDNVDLSGEFFCQEAENPSVDRGREPRTYSLQYSQIHGRHIPSDFGDWFLPALQKDDEVLGDRIPELCPDDVSVSSTGQPRPGLHVAASPIYTASLSGASANSRDFPVTWPDVDTTQSRQAIASLRRSVSDYEPVCREPLWLPSGLDRTGQGNGRRRAMPRRDGRLISQLNFEQDTSSSSSSSSPGHTVQLHRSEIDHFSPPNVIINDAEHSWSNEYFTSMVNSFSNSLKLLTICRKMLLRYKLFCAITLQIGLGPFTIALYWFH